MQQGMGCSALKISKIDKTPTPHHRKNAALLKGAIDLVGSREYIMWTFENWNGF